MSTFKIFDGTNWLDPCNCNISILDIDNVTYRQINPNNCIVSYFDGVNWCPITCPCDCPDGYTFNPATNSCELIEIQAATPSGGVTDPIVAGSQSVAYGDFGARLYEDISGKVYPINGWQDTGICLSCASGYQAAENAGAGAVLSIQQTSDPANDIFNAQGSSTQGRLNIAGLWATGYPVNEWLPLTYCLNIAETKTYIFAIAGDNQIKASITSSTFNGGGTFNLVNLWGSDDPSGVPSDSSKTNPFKIWHMFPITLPAGTHTLELSGYNFGGSASFGAEIYDISEGALIGLMTSTTATPSDLEPYIIFTTESLVIVPPLEIPEPGEVITWDCPVGTTFSECYGAPACITETVIPCGSGEVLNKTTEINIWFDDSGSMDTTRLPLEIMHSTILKECLLPIYDYDETVYNERVKIINMKGDTWDYSQRFAKCLAEERNFDRTPDLTVDQVINLTFSDKSDIYGYSSAKAFDNSIIAPAYESDISNLRSVLSTIPYTLKGTAFRVNSGPDAYLGFRGLTQATFINNGEYRVPNNISDYYDVNFNCNLDTVAAGTPTYYRNQITAALKALNINIPVCP